jgi:hypothetical protein
MTEIRNDLGLERLGPGEAPREVQPARDAAAASTQPAPITMASNHG